MKEEFNRLKTKGYSNNAFEKYLNNPNVKRIYDESQLAELKAIWYGEEVMEQEKETLSNIAKSDTAIPDEFEGMTKDELDQYSIDTYGIDLDKRYSKQNMINELKEELKKQNEE